MLANPRRVRRSQSRRRSRRGPPLYIEEEDTQVTLEALIFDVDGTLADTEELHRQAFNGAFYEYGLRWNWNPHVYAALLHLSGGKERIRHYLEGLDLDREERRRIVALIPDLHAAKTRLFARLVESGRAPMRPGVVRLMREAHEAGVRLAVASTTTPANLEALVSKYLGDDAVGWFSVVAAGDQVANKKPAPDIYLLVLRTLGVNASECVAFEDSERGLRAAQAAGLFTVVTPTFWTTNEDLASADLALPHLGDPGAPLDDGAAVKAGGAWLTLAALEGLVHARAPVGAR
jgi:HAD superfamily hydrolase (TIGR01509 family)